MPARLNIQKAGKVRTKVQVIYVESNCIECKGPYQSSLCIGETKGLIFKEISMLCMTSCVSSSSVTVAHVVLADVAG